MNRLFPVLCLGVVLGACKSDQGIGIQVPPVYEVNPPPLEDPVNTDVIVQVTTPMVDVLWVMDNSGSMSCVTGCHGSLTEKVTENFPKFMDYFVGSGLDYHIGVITTDLDDPNESGRLEYGLGYKYIDLLTSDPVSVFFEMATVGTEGSGQERGLGTTFNAIDVLGDTYNAGFYRDEATLHTTVLSNEDDFTPPSVISQSEFVDWYDDLKDETDERTFNSLVCVNTGSEECPDQGTQYIRTTEEVGGIVWDITGDDWAGLLDQLGAQAAGLKREYFLSQLPVPSTIEVEVEQVNGALIEFAETVDWTYDGNRNSITFLEYVPESLSKVMITYTVASSVVEAGGEEVVETAGGAP
jgi:hypothetical protein